MNQLQLTFIFTQFYVLELDSLSLLHVLSLFCPLVTHCAYCFHIVCEELLTPDRLVPSLTALPPPFIPAAPAPLHARCCSDSRSGRQAVVRL